MLQVFLEQSSSQQTASISIQDSFIRSLIYLFIHLLILVCKWFRLVFASFHSAQHLEVKCCSSSEKRLRKDVLHFCGEPEKCGR